MKNLLQFPNPKWLKFSNRVWVTSLLQSQYILLKHLPLSNYISRHKSASAEDTILVCEPFPNNLLYNPCNCEILMCFPSVQQLCCTECTSTVQLCIYHITNHIGNVHLLCCPLKGLIEFIVNILKFLHDNASNYPQ